MARKKTATAPVLPDDLDSNVVQLLSLMRDLGRIHTLRDPVGGVLAETINYSSLQCHAIMWIGDEQPMTMGTLARRLGINEKSVTGIVDRLEEDHLVARTRDADDRRVITLKLTEQGRKLAGRFVTHISSRFRHLLSFLDPADRSALFRILTTLRDRLGASPAGSLTEVP